MNLPQPLLKAVTSHWPFANGSGRFLDKFGDHLDLGRGARTCRSSDGFDIDVFADDLIGRHLLISGQFDRTPVQVLLDFSKPGDHVLDAGANIGYVSCCILQRIADSVLIAVEPHPQVADLLRTNLARFGSARSRIIEAALSGEDGRVSFNLNPDNRGASSIHYASTGGSVSVATVSADRVLGELDRLDLIKVDVEGHEEQLFGSAADQIERLQPRAIIFEDRDDKAAPAQPLGAILNRIGYDVYGIAKSLTRTTLVPVASEADCSHNDYVAVSRRFGLPEAVARKYRVKPR